MAQSTADRNLLFGILALQLNFITQEALITAMKTWTSEKATSLGQILKSQGVLNDEDVLLLDSLVQRLLVKYQNDAQQCLAAVTTLTAFHHNLGEVGDHEIDFSIGLLKNVAEETTDYPGSDHSHVGAVSSQGGRFLIGDFHAKGGQGEVWIAEDTELHRKVALKKLQDHCADNPWSRIQFVHEAEVTGALEHRGIAPVYGRGYFDDGRPFYAMRFIAGTNFKDAIKKFHSEEPFAQVSDERSLELRRLLGRFVDVCNAVAYAHTRGVIHRDIKRGNIIIDEYGETLLVDWGLAKSGCHQAESQLSEPAFQPVSVRELPSTVAGAKLGTPAFMSPEQAAGRNSEVGTWSDVYSLGATLYCLLTGKLPFDGDDSSELMRKVSAGDFLKPRGVDPRVSVALEAICLKAMSLNPSDRYSNARDLGDDIERWLADQPVSAYPEPFPVRARRWVRRHKQWVAAGAAMLLLTVIGLAIYDWRITREKARTTDQLAMTRDSLRELLKVSGENLGFIPNTERLREYLAQLVLDRYQRLGDKFPTDPAVQLETAQVLRVIAGIGRITGEYARSRESYENAIKKLTTLCENDPGQAEYRRWLAEVLIDRGELNHMNGRTIDAEEDFHAAIDHADRLMSVQVSPAFLRAKAAALINLAEILTLKNQHTDAHKAADQAVNILHPLTESAEDANHITRDQWLLCMAFTDRGVASGGVGDVDQADRDFNQAARVAAQVPQGDEEYDDTQFQLAIIANQRGELLATDSERLSEAVTSFEQASLILMRLIKDHKLIPHYREEIAVTLSGQAAVHLAQGRNADSHRDREAALGHVEWLIGERAGKGAPENPEYLSLLGRILALKGRTQVLEGQVGEGRKTLGDAVEKLGRAVEIDPARVADRVKLDQIKAGSL